MFPLKLLPIRRRNRIHLLLCVVLYNIALLYLFSGSKGYKRLARLRRIVESYSKSKTEFMNFEPAMSETESQASIKLMQGFDYAMRSANISYVMCGGTLIGSVRHHGRVPWDDDIDVLINFKDRNAAESALNGFQSIFRYVQPTDEMGKYYSIYGKPFSEYQYTYPFIDIWFYVETGTHVIYSTVDGQPSWREIEIPKKYYFPLVRRPFEVFSLLSPCNPFEALKAEGNDLSVCRGEDYNHLLEEKVYNTNEEPCHKLRKYYPFVSITEMNESHVIESLEYNNSVIRTVLVQKVC